MKRRPIPEPVVRFAVDSLGAELREKLRAYFAAQGFPLADEEPDSDRPTLRAPPPLETPRPSRGRSKR